MHLFRIAQSFWVVCFVLYLLWAWTKTEPGNLIFPIYGTFLGVYAIACVGTFWDLRWAWVVSVALLSLAWLRYAAFLAINIHEMIFGTLYLDSPATAVVVVIQIIPTLGYTSALFLILYCKRKELISIFRSEK